MVGVSVHPETSIQYLKGIGPKRFEALKRLGYETISELFYFFPRRYEDRSHFRPIRSARISEFITIKGEILDLKVRPVKRLEIFEMLVGDSSGTIHASWFNQGYLKKNFEIGEQIILSGKVEFYNRLQLNSPEYEVLISDEEETIHTGRITPIYPLTEGLWQRTLRTAMKQLVDQHAGELLHEYLPSSIRMRHDLIELTPAIQNIHFPESSGTLAQARKRLIFDEFFLFELALLEKRTKEKREGTAIPIPVEKDFLEQFTKSLPFALTGSQKKVIREILADISKDIPMRRLLQGDVGSGKTLVALSAVLQTVRAGYQGAFLAPTEILAEQHYKTMTKIFGPLGINTRLLTGSTDEISKNDIRNNLRTNKNEVVVGTHAILQDNVKFSNLGLVIIDEQHKFGVKQRGHLLKGTLSPHLLVMTATPIPRTLGLTLYGDLELSTITELPAGREPIKTYWITQKKEKEVFEFIIKKLKAGDQAYIVFPTIEETEKVDVQAATKEYEKLKKGAFKDFTVGLVHGRMDSKEKDYVMRRFHAGEIHLLIATSVIEVGIDNPQASIMVIENAERFGLSQLHQLRGRVGRGSKASYCFLFGNPKTDDGKRRLRVLTKTGDGFKIAEEDLLIRGPGDFLGTRQHGVPQFALANLVTDYEILKTAREEAIHLLEKDSCLKHPELSRLNERLKQYTTYFQD
ncbi:MAG: ATP-dependent DNA helicase RecG [Candidatus Omnitrophica bacterium]|nr:ATP-dependent DNA helicase RecG [Candidatus Omnitrophota bacterium]